MVRDIASRYVPTDLKPSAAMVADVTTASAPPAGFSINFSEITILVVDGAFSLSMHTVLASASATASSTNNQEIHAFS